MCGDYAPFEWWPTDGCPGNLSVIIPTMKIAPLGDNLSVATAVCCIAVPVERRLMKRCQVLVREAVTSQE